MKGGVMCCLKKGDVVALKMSDGRTYEGVFDCMEEKWGHQILWMYHNGRRFMFNATHLLDCWKVGE